MTMEQGGSQQEPMYREGQIWRVLCEHGPLQLSDLLVRVEVSPSSVKYLDIDDGLRQLREWGMIAITEPSEDPTLAITPHSVQD